MTTTEQTKGFLRWYKALQHIAENNESQWLVSADANAHFGAYQKGFSPEEELAELDELAQWRGCGCGGS